MIDMKIFTHLRLKKFTRIVVFLGAMIIAFPAVDVFAASQSPSDLNIFSITGSEQNQQLDRNCGYSTGEGIISGTASALETITSIKYEDYADVIYCQEGDTAQLFGPEQSTGVVGLLNRVNRTLLDQRPASGVQFLEEKVYAITNPGVVYAQDPASYFPGTGFDLLQPIRAFWGWSVNFVFGFLVILILLIAFAIIFRVNLPGNITITIQNAIPNIALAMILVPLSYAISGLFIDAITIGSNAVHDFLLGPSSPGYSVYTSRATGEDDRGLYIDDERVTWIQARNLVDVRQEVEAVGLQANLDAAGLNVIAGFLNILDENTINDTSANPGTGSAWLGTIINAILSILMIWIGIKMFIRLFKKYITLMIMPIFAPFIFATVAVPGNGTKAIMNFVKMMGSASLGFIVAYAMILLTVIFSSSAFQATIPDFRTGLWTPPLLSLGDFVTGTVSSTVGGSGIVPFVMALIGIGIYFSIPGVLDQIDQALGATMSLPQFIKTPIESFREASRITFRAAPAAGLRVGKSTYAAGDSINRTRTNAVFNVRRSYEQAIGLDQDNPNSVVYQRKQANLQKRQDLLRQLDATAGDPSKFLERKNIESQLAALDRSEKLQGGEFSTRGEEGKDRKMKWSVNYYNQDGAQGAKTFTKNEILDFETRLSSGRTGILKIVIGEIVIEPENMQFPDRVLLEIGGYKESRGTFIYDTSKFSASTWEGIGGNPPTNIFDVLKRADTKAAVSSYIGLSEEQDPSKDKLLLSEEGRKISQKAVLVLFESEFDLLFGDRHKGGTRVGLLSNVMESDRRIAKFASYYTGALKIALRLSTQ